jgi:C4-dicarboxylate-specific signal transduction histidine kinase
MTSPHSGRQGRPGGTCSPRASLAHEIIQPLTAIATNAHAARRLLPTSSTEDDELSEALADIAGDAERAGSIVRRLRALVRKQPGERQLIDVNATVTEVTAILRWDIVRADVSVQLRLAENLPRVIGDAVQLQQVVLNLLVNACQAMAGVVDGPRVLRIETAEPKPGSVAITVADTGAGVTGPELERMFEPFVSSKPGGLGMGLSINRSIVEAHGRHIVATRNPDRGLTLHVTLPTAKTGHADPRGPSTVPDEGPLPAREHASG